MFEILFAILWLVVSRFCICDLNRRDNVLKEDWVSLHWGAKVFFHIIAPVIYFPVLEFYIKEK